MAQLYPVRLPQDNGGTPMQNYPSPKVANTRYSTENGTASSVISLNANTTTIEVVAVGQAAVIRWVPTTETASVSPFASVISATSGANFDHIIVTGESRRFVVPIEAYPTASILATHAGANLTNGLYQRVAIKTTGIGSVLLAEY